MFLTCQLPTVCVGGGGGGGGGGGQKKMLSGSEVDGDSSLFFFRGQSGVKT